MKGYQVKYNPDKPGVYVYDSFDYDWESGSFTTAIVAEISSIQYFRDRPLLLKEIDPVLAPAINLTPSQAADYVNEPKIQSYLDSLEQVYAEQAIFEEEMTTIMENITELADIEPNVTTTSQMIVPPSTIKIIDADGSTFEIDTEGEEQLITMTEEEFLDDVEDRAEGIIAETEQIPVVQQPVSDAMETMSEDINQSLPEGEPEPVPDLSYLADPIKQWYGIPLINLGPSQTPTKDSFILQVNTGRNWAIDITGLVNTGLPEDELRLEVEVKPDTKFLVGLHLFKNTVTIFFKGEGSPVFYQKTVTFTEQPAFELIGYGTDSENLKTLCGYLWDIWFQKTPSAINTNLPNQMPTYPKDDTVFDFNEGRVQGSFVYPSADYQNPAYNSGSWLVLPADWKQEDTDGESKAPTQMDSWKFMQDGYLSRIFCRDNIRDTSFTITWLSYFDGYPQGIKTLVSDDIQSNYLQYDFDNFELIVSFNGIVHRSFVTLPVNVLAYYSFRYCIESGDLIFAFTDFDTDTQEEAQYNIGTDLTFELMTMFGRFDRGAKGYTEVMTAVSGNILIARECKTDDTLRELYFNSKSIFEKYDIKEVKEQDA